MVLKQMVMAALPVMVRVVTSHARSEPNTSQNQAAEITTTREHLPSFSRNGIHRNAVAPATMYAQARVGLRPMYAMVKMQMTFAGTSTKPEMNVLRKTLPTKSPVFSERP